MSAPTPLRDYQIADLAYYIANPKCMNLSDPGVGKTPSVCVMQYYRWTEQGIGTAWVQPKGLLAKNRRELLRFTDFKPEDVVIVDGPPEQVKDQLQSGAKVFLMGFRRWALSNHALPDYVKAVDVDEWQKAFRKINSGVTQSLVNSFGSGRMRQFIPMTGTIMAGALDSVYPAIHIIEPRYYASYNDFLNQHAIRDLDNKIIGWHNHDKIRRILQKHGIRRTFSSVYGEQEIVQQVEVAEMTPLQREYYDRFEKEAVLELEKFYVDGTQPGVGFLRARQIMEHPNHFPDLTQPGEFIDLLNGEQTGKEMLLDQHLEDHVVTGDPVLIYTQMIPQQMRIKDMLTKAGIPFGIINGSVPMQERDEIDKQFAEGKIRAILGTPSTMDVGLNFQWCGEAETSHVIFVTPDYLDSTLLQAIRRAMRGVRKSPLRVTFMKYADSIDERVFQIVRAKSIDAHLVDPDRPIFDFGE